MRIIMIIAGLILSMQLIGGMQQQTFEDCMNAGFQSEETCKIYSR